MTPPVFPLRRTVEIMLQQVALAALLSLLLVCWLHVPDANAFEVFASVLIALLIVCVAGVGETLLALRLTNRAIDARHLLRGIGILFVTALLYFFVSSGVDHLAVNDGLRAGYLNSRFPASLRNIFTYEHLVTWQGWLESALRWIAAGLLAAAAFVLITCNAPVQALLTILRSGRYWLSLLLLALVGSVITGKLLYWTPGHGLGVEMMSLTLRMVTVVVLNAATVAFLLQSMTSAVFRLQSVGTGEPAISQSRTLENP